MSTLVATAVTGFIRVTCWLLREGRRHTTRVARLATALPVCLRPVPVDLAAKVTDRLGIAAVLVVLPLAHAVLDVGRLVARRAVDKQLSAALVALLASRGSVPVL